MTDERDESDPLSDDDMFDEAPVKAPPAPVVEKVEEEEVPEVEEEAEADPEPEEKPPEEPTASKQKSVPMAALIDERRKRQAAEDKLRQLEGGAQIDPATEALNRTINISRDLILDSHKDYPEMEKIFMDLVSEEAADGKGIRITDPALYEKFRNSANPAKFAYNHAKQHKDYLDRTSPDFEKNLREKIEKELLAKHKLKPDASTLPNLTTLAASANNTVQPKEVSPADDEGVWD